MKEKQRIKQPMTPLKSRIEIEIPDNFFMTVVRAINEKVPAKFVKIQNFGPVREIGEERGEKGESLRDSFISHFKKTKKNISVAQLKGIAVDHGYKPNSYSYVIHKMKKDKLVKITASGNYDWIGE